MPAQKVVELLGNIKGDDNDNNQRKCQQESLEVLEQYVSV